MKKLSIIVLVILISCQNKYETKKDVHSSIKGINEINEDIIGEYLIHVTEKEWNELFNDYPVEDFNEKMDMPSERYIAIPAGPNLGNDGFVIFPPKCSDICERKYNQEFPLGRCDCHDLIGVPNSSSDTNNISVSMCFVNRMGGNATCKGRCNLSSNCKLKRSKVTDLRAELYQELKEKEIIDDIKDREIVFKK